MREQHDMRNAMTRLAPRDPISVGGNNLFKQLADLREPIITKADGSQALDLRLDVSNYKPEEISIATKGRELSIQAKHEEKDENSSVYQEFHRKFTLPENVDIDGLSSNLTKDGILTITGPVNPALNEPPKKIPIDKK
ncbi:hypothetical protein SNE40_003135 [Patella caerulea]